MDPCTVPIDPGVYLLTPPNFLPAASVQITTTTPFVMESPSQFRARPPYALTSAEYAADLNEVKLVGSKNSTVRTQDQTDKAIFCGDGSNITFAEVPRLYAIDHELGVAESARLLAMTQTAIVDAFIGIWDIKYTYNFDHEDLID